MIKTAMAFFLGCLLCLFISPAYFSALIWLSSALLLISIWQQKWLLASCVFAVLLTGYQVETIRHDQLLPEQASSAVMLTGKIISLPDSEDHVIRFMFQPDDETFPSKLRLSWYYPPKPLPKAGESWQIEVKLKPPRGLKNPGTFDYEKWLFSQRIGATGYVRKNPHNHRLSVANAFDLNHWRGQLQQRLSQLATDANFLPLMEGLSIGYRANIDQTQWQVLRQTGTSHLLAISGLHIGLAAAVGFFLMRWLWSLSTRLLYYLPAQRAASIGGFGFALFYALLAGLSIPTQRALIMVTTVMLALWLNRPVYPSHILALSLVIVLLVDPLAALSAGFWLSYAAVALILLVSLHRYPAPKRQLLTIHIWIAVGLTPLLIIFFGQTSLISPLANLLAVPWVSFVIVPLLLLCVCLLWISETAASGLLWLVDQTLTALWLWLDWLAQFEYADWTLPQLPISLAAVVLFGVGLLLLPRAFPGKYWGLLSLPLLFFYSPERPETGLFQLSVLDVGQGLSIVIETHQHTLVYDTGAAFSESFDMGSAVVVPFLQARGVKQIDALVISHTDNDHHGGTAAVLAQLPVKQLISSDTSIDSRTQRCQAGQHWQWDGVDFEFLHPVADDQLSKNNRSCVLQVRSDAYHVLLTGDIESQVERDLIRQYGHTLKSDILIAPHHGSKTSSSPAFIKAVSPNYAVFSAGYLNRYRFPAETVLKRYQQYDINVARTDHHGAILFNEQAEIQYWRQFDRRLWSSSATE